MNNLINRAGRSCFSCLLLLLLGFLPADAVRAQTWEIGVTGGAVLYHGEFVPIPYLERYKLLRPAGGLFLRYGPVDWFGVRLGAMATQLHGSAQYNGITVYRDLPVDFKTPLQELTLTFEFSPADLRIFGLAARPYGATGIAAFRFEPRLRIDGEWIEMQPLGTEGQGLPGNPGPYRTTRLALPLSVGLRLALSDRVILGTEISARFTYTDYLDDVSGKLVNYPLLQAERGETIARISNPEATELTDDYQRGNLASDSYHFLLISLHYRFADGGQRAMDCFVF